MTDRRVVVTGIGAVTPLGLDIEKTWAGVKAGKCGIRPISSWDCSEFDQKIGGEVIGFNGADWLYPGDAAHYDSFVQFAVASASMAIEDSGLLVARERGSRTGTCIATATGSVRSTLDQQAKLLQNGPREVSPIDVPYSFCDMASGYISQMYKLEGPCHCLMSASASGSSAIGEAYYMIQRGSVDAMVVGASDAIAPVHAAAFASAKVLSTANEEPEKASRPFDGKRDGFVLSEGSAVLVLEELRQARSRGAKVYGEIVGYGSCSDAFHLTKRDPSGRGAVRAMREAIDIANIDPRQVSYVNAHATSSRLGDRVEVGALRTIFGKNLERLPVSSTKSSTGHMMGTAGAIEAIFSLLTLRDQILPPTINQEVSDPECDIDTVPNAARSARVEFVMSNSFGFGGHNVSLLFRRLN